MANANVPAKVNLKDSAVKAELAQKVGKVMTITGKLSGGDPIKKLEGEELAKDIEFQRQTQHRKFPILDPHYKFRISDAALKLVDKDVAERYLFQNIYQNADGVKMYGVETKTDFTIGYVKENGKITPIKRESLKDKKFAFGQEVTLTYSVYMNKTTGEASIGFENMFFSKKPEFYAGGAGADTIGAVESQGWDTSEIEDFSDVEGSVVPNAAEAAEAAEAAPAETEVAASAGDGAGLWGSAWE